VALTAPYTTKRIDNSRLRRPKAPGQVRQLGRWLGVGLLFASCTLLYAWQHFRCLQMGYQLEELKAERARAAEQNLQLRLEAAALRSPMRIDAIARGELGLTAPVPGQVVPLAGPGQGALAHARPREAPAQ